MKSILPISPMQEFRKVTVVPSIERRGPIFRGGPIWPRWDTQVFARHCRRNRPVDSRPDDPETTPKVYDGSAIWIGPIYWQFGHQIAEFSTRIVQSMDERNGDKLIFSVMPQFVGKMTWETAPAHFRAISEWFGVSREIVELCHEPITIEHLRVAKQGEQLGGIGPSSQYLDLLDENWEKKTLSPDITKTTYVSRANLAPYFGSHAGALYLDDVLRKAGVNVIYPESMTLTAQLLAYKGAETLIFSEGSALHGLQLLGRGLGSVVVLNRRTVESSGPRRMAAPQIRPRARHLSYLNVVESLLQFYNAEEIGLANSAISLFNTERLLDEFNALGIDLRPHWDEKAYIDMKERDICSWLSTGWLRHVGERGISTQQLLLDDLDKAGLGHLRVFVTNTLVRT
ncbi:MAG: DUF563 domain-containing protein [Rhodobacteraceae bacterium]|nr:DUF563 domain-containing protein [Paracoccaceae bacterium]